MTPEEIKTATLDELQKAVTKMMSPEWDLALDGKSNEVVDKATKSLLAVQKCRLLLENAELNKISQKMIENEKALSDGKANLNKALTDLKNVQNVLDGVTAFLQIVGRIVAVAGHVAGGG